MTAMILVPDKAWRKVVITELPDLARVAEAKMSGSSRERIRIGGLRDW